MLLFFISDYGGCKTQVRKQIRKQEALYHWLEDGKGGFLAVSLINTVTITKAVGILPIHANYGFMKCCLANRAELNSEKESGSSICLSSIKINWGGGSGIWLKFRGCEHNYIE